MCALIFHFFSNYRVAVKCRDDDGMYNTKKRLEQYTLDRAIVILYRDMINGPFRDPPQRRTRSAQSTFSGRANSEGMEPPARPASIKGPNQARTQHWAAPARSSEALTAALA